MTDEKEPLAELRQKIDDIDDSVHDLLMRRAEIVSELKRRKRTRSGAMPLRPGREAEILRRLLERHTGDLPFSAIYNVWREIMSDFAQMQAPFFVQIFGNDQPKYYFDLARGYFGASCRLSLQESATNVISRVAKNPDTLGFLPYPQSGDPGPWWSHLISSSKGSPRVIGIVPFVTRDSDSGEAPAALIVGCEGPDQSGDDITLIAVASDEEISHGRIADQLEEAVLPGREIATWNPALGEAPWFRLFAVDGHLKRQDKRLNALLRQKGSTISQISVIGSYARPIRLPHP